MPGAAATARLPRARGRGGTGWDRVGRGMSWAAASGSPEPAASTTSHPPGIKPTPQMVKGCFSVHGGFTALVFRAPAIKEIFLPCFSEACVQPEVIAFALG